MDDRRRRAFGRWGGLAAAIALGVGAAPARAAPPAQPSACKLIVPRGGQLDVELKGRRILLPVTLNGKPIRAILDTGATASAILGGAAARLGLSLQRVEGARFYGVGGMAHAMSTRVDLAFLGVELKGARMLVLGSTRGGDIDMVLGQDLLAGYDLELDLAHKLVRLETAEHCVDDDMAYWAPSYSQAPIIDDGEGLGREIVVPVRINGRGLRAVLDTGAPVSVATRKAAAAARVSLARGPQADVRASGGVGARIIPEQVAAVTSFEVGGEQIRNTALRFSDLFGGAEQVNTGSHVPEPVADLNDMLLGYDFVAAHHLLISPSHHKVFFTYNGGQVFDTGVSPRAPPPTPAAPPA